MHCACTTLSFVVCPVLQYVSTLSHKEHDCREKKKLSNIRRVFWFSLQFLSDTFLILRRSMRGKIKNVHWSSRIVAVILVRFWWTSRFLDRFSKNAHIWNFMKIRPVETALHADGRRDITKLLVAFRSFANASKAYYLHGKKFWFNTQDNDFWRADGLDVRKRGLESLLKRWWL